jgi:squalene-associated FAD-dependent desaturase
LAALSAWFIDVEVMDNASSTRPATAAAKQIAIVGGGLAGMAAAVAAVERGCRVELFEQSKTLGGRAASFVDPQNGALIDYCQHVAMGCCSEFLDFCRRTGIDDCFDRAETLHFIGPDGRQCDFTPSRWLPAPLHLLPGLLRLSYLSWPERWGIVRALHKLVQEHGGDIVSSQENKTANSRGLTAPGDGANKHRELLAPGYATKETRTTIGTWLRRQGQSDRAIERFWSFVLVSALGETVDRASLAAAGKVFRDGFWASRQASTLILPRRPLVEIFHDRLGKWLADRGVTVHLDTPVRRIDGDGRRAGELASADGTRYAFDAAIVAVPWRSVRSLFAENLLSQMPALAEVDRIEPAAITAVHLWFDRPITRLPHAVLVGRLSQWLFARPCGAGVSPAGDDAGVSPAGDDAGGTLAPQYYCQVVVSASHRLAPRTNQEWLADVRGELESAWPAARQAKLLHGRVVTLPAAVFSMTPEVEQFRPRQRTPLENLCLAGDWTLTGWPATMEGAVRSGRQAVESLLSGIVPGPVGGEEM